MVEGRFELSTRAIDTFVKGLGVVSRDDSAVMRYYRSGPDARERE